MQYDAITMTIWGIPPYMFFACIGIVASLLAHNCLMLYHGAKQNYGNFVALISLPALLIGAKVFGIIENLASCIFYGKAITLDTFLNSGIVFYGGLIFFIISVLLWTCRLSLEDRNRILDSVAVSIPLFHVFGRIGCFAAGCCYGVCTESFFSVEYTTLVHGEVNTAHRIPIQLVEAFLNLLIFAVLLYMTFKKIRKGKLLSVYIVIYAVVRFVNEFFRGDLNKDVWYGTTMAQIISVILFLIIVIQFIRERLNSFEEK